MGEPFAHIYAAVPPINCQGLCGASCGPLIIDPPERAHITAATGRHLPDLQPVCPLLDLSPLGQPRCTIYPHRPLLCRLWGTVESMPCPHGCQPDHYLTDEQGHVLLDRARQGGP